MISRDRGGRLTTSRRNFIKAGAVAGALTVNVNWPSVLAAQQTEGENSMLFHLDFHVEYSADMTQNDLFTIWADEATEVLQAKEAALPNTDFLCLATTHKLRRRSDIINIYIW